MKKLRPFTEADVTDESAFFTAPPGSESIRDQRCRVVFAPLRRPIFLAGLRATIALQHPQVSRLITVSPPSGKIRFL